MIKSFNEWDPLREIVVGTATNANWPADHPDWAEEARHTLWKETPLPSGPVPQWVIDEANEDLEALCGILRTAGATVHRPADMDFVALAGLYNYCPRDRVIVAGTMVIDPSMMYSFRQQEIQALLPFIQDAPIVTMPRNMGMVLDAANVLRMNDQWLFLESRSGNQSAYRWLQETLPEVTIELCNFYAGVHIDSTITVLREGLVVLNGSRVTESTVPKCLAGWDKIWVTEVEEQGFYQYPYASKWIALNMLSINPQTVIVDAAQTVLIKRLEQHGLTVVPASLRHSRTLGGGFHCVTLDLCRG